MRNRRVASRNDEASGRGVEEGRREDIEEVQEDGRGREEKGGSEKAEDD